MIFTQWSTILPERIKIEKVNGKKSKFKADN